MHIARSTSRCVPCAGGNLRRLRTSRRDTNVLSCVVQVGYVIPGVKDVHACRVGDTWHLAKVPVQALPGFKPVKPMVFAGKYHTRKGEGGWAPAAAV
jgi:translation elongation factor EF-4